MLEIIKETGVFLIFAETLYQFVQENRYARYVRLLIRLMTLAILILPVLDLFREGSSAMFYEKLHAMDAGYAADTGRAAVTDMERDEMEEQIARVNAEQEIAVQASAEIKTTCNKCAEENGYRISEVTITESGITFLLTPYPDEISVTQIEQVTIGGETSGEACADRKETAHTQTQEELTMKQVLAEYLGIADALIEVRIYD